MTERVKWNIARDVFVFYGFKRGLELAKKCSHPNAVKLCRIFENADNNKSINTILEENNMFDFVTPTPESRSLYAEIRWELGYSNFNYEVCYLEEPLGLYREYKITGNTAYLVKACKLGCVPAMVEATRNGLGDLKYFLKVIKYADYCESARMVHIRASYESDRKTYSNIVFKMGKRFKLWDIHDTGRQFFIVEYEFMRKLAINSVHLWSLIGRRLGICKDIRIYIGKFIWTGKSYL